MADRDQYLLRSLVTAQRERKMAMKTRDPGLIKSAETRLAVAWKNATDHVDATIRSAVMRPRPMPCDACPHATLCADFPEQHRKCSGVGRSAAGGEGGQQ